MIFGINTTRDISKLSQISRAITYNKLFQNITSGIYANITTNHAITYTNIFTHWPNSKIVKFSPWINL